MRVRACFMVRLVVVGRRRRTLTSLLITAARRAVRTRRQVFVPRQLAVMILVERQQLRRGVCDLIRIDYAVVVDVERLEEGQGRRTMMSSLRATTGASLLIPLLIAARTVLLVPLWAALWPSLLVALRAVWTGRSVLVRRQFAIVVFVERQQLRRGICDFIGIDHAIVVNVERFHERRRRRTMMVMPSLLSLSPTALWRRAALVLREDRRRSQTNNRYCHPNKPWYFHNFDSFLPVINTAIVKTVCAKTGKIVKEALKLRRNQPACGILAT